MMLVEDLRSTLAMPVGTKVLGASLGPEAQPVASGSKSSGRLIQSPGTERGNQGSL